MTQRATRNTHHASRFTLRTEWLALVAVLLAAAAFRLIALDAVPPGLHHDEVIIAQVAKDILRGRLAIYFPEGYGHEPLYHYVLAGMFAVGGANEFTLRLTTALLGILTVALTYRMARTMFGPRVALVTSAWMAVSLWPVFYSRVGLRNLTLPLMIALTAWLLWTSLRSRISNLKFVCAGVAFGLTFYTYQGSRVFPLIFLLFIVYLWVLHRNTLAQRWKGLLLFFGVAALVVAPLAYYLTIVNPQAEARVPNLTGPLQAAFAGNPSQVLQLALATAGMFTVRGDGVWLYNVGGRPVFPEPISGALFYAGLLIALWRWRKPAYALLLIWLPISLIPAAITWPAPDFVRALGALPVAFIFLAIALTEVSNLIGRTPHLKFEIWHLIFAVLIVVNGAWTAHDYFDVWPRNGQVRWLYQTTWTQATRWLDASPDTTPVAASGLRIHDLDPQTFDILLRRRDIKVKWFDCRTSVLLPTSGAMRYLSPDFFPCDADLWTRFLGDAQIIAQPRWPDSDQLIFVAHRLERADTNLSGLTNLAGLGRFGPLSLTGSEITRPTIAPSGEAELLTFWIVTQRVPAPTAIFVHLVGSDGKPRAQWDGFDFGEAQLEPGDQLIERHRFTAPPGMGAYHIVVGVYDPVTMRRLTLPNGDDHVELGTVNVR